MNLLTGKNYLVISPESWENHTVSKHHYAMELASENNNRVYFLNPPSSSYRSIDVKVAEGYDNLWVVNAPKVYSGLRFFPNQIRRYIEYRWLTRFEKKLNVSIDIVWLFENSRFFDMSFARNKLKIYHQVDLNQDFHVETAATSADMCFCTTDFIKERLEIYNSKVFKIHHGFSGRNLMSPLTRQQANFFSSDSGVDTIHVIYIGNLDIQYLDTDILQELVRKKRRQKLLFHLIGSYNLRGSLFQALGKEKNTCWWGNVDSSIIPSILQTADLLLVVYKADNFKEQLASPHKFMEYFSSGKCIVSTYTDEYKDKRHLLEMVDDNDEYIERFEYAIENLKAVNSTERMQERVLFSQKHTYQKQLAAITVLLHENEIISQDVA